MNEFTVGDTHTHTRDDGRKKHGRFVKEKEKKKENK
jgi:hypothetical protein